jgi:purine-binding chemotaxis protein CheW
MIMQELKNGDYNAEELFSGDFNAELPWLVFKLHDLAYTINSRIVTSILQMPPTVTPIASAPPMFRGVLNFRGEVLPLLDLRTLFGLTSGVREAQEMNEQFAQMKEAHFAWVNALRDYLENGTSFTKSLDPATCALGKLLNKYLSSTGTASPVVKSLDLIHRRLHDGGKALIEKTKLNPNIKRAELVNDADFKALESIPREVSNRLDQLLETLTGNRREMIVVISNDDVSLGLIVDEVVAVDSLDIVSSDDKFPSFQTTKYFSGVAESTKIPGEILLVNEPLLLGTLQKYDVIV